MVMPDPSVTAIQLTVVGMLSQKLGLGFPQAMRLTTPDRARPSQVLQDMQQGEARARCRGLRSAQIQRRQGMTNQTVI